MSIPLPSERASGDWSRADPSRHSRCQTYPMVTEHALLPVRPGLEAEFEQAFDEARAIISSMPGFERLSLSRSVESPGTYLLLVDWVRIDDHTVGFRQSEGYQEWSALLHRFYDPFPTVEHFEIVLSTAD